jgi:hypothetical protein
MTNCGKYGLPIRCENPSWYKVSVESNWFLKITVSPIKELSIMMNFHFGLKSSKSKS